MTLVEIFVQMSAITKIRETARNSEILPPNFAAFQLESKDSHFINGNINKCQMGDVCQISGQY